MKHSIFEAKKIIDRSLKELNIYDYLYNDSEVTEVTINSDQKIFIKRSGEGFVEVGKSENDKVISILNTLATLRSITLGLENPEIDGELPLTKSRVVGIISPVVENPTFNIRKKIPVIKTLEDYLKDEFITKEVYNYLKASVLNKKSILVVGGTNTGKTTFLNALISAMDINKRVILVEEVEELQTKAVNVQRLKIIPGIYSAERALKTCMRLTPEIIIFGEIRGIEAYEFIKALNSGHEGGLSTIHANNCLLGLKKMEMYTRTAIGHPLSEELAMGVNILVTLKEKNHTRYLDSIVEVLGYDSVKNEYKLKPIYQKEEGCIYEDNTII
ncbi:MAG: ATPase, T2SS/T4P/T4SS family [Cetobacterium sp.]|uniref:ATPase, T2SS/T4P/T4SS family n=1 Tax=Cetobacterium sp. TaxID=2071632 RepID=UPI003F3E29E8